VAVLFVFTRNLIVTPCMYFIRQDCRKLNSLRRIISRDHVRIWFGMCWMEVEQWVIYLYLVISVQVESCVQSRYLIATSRVCYIGTCTHAHGCYIDYKKGFWFSVMHLAYISFKNIWNTSWHYKLLCWHKKGLFFKASWVQCGFVLQQTQCPEYWMELGTGMLAKLTVTDSDILDAISHFTYSCMGIKLYTVMKN
jgi:hypothetical protein